MMDPITFTAFKEFLSIIGDAALVFLLPLAIANFLNIRDGNAQVKIHIVEDELLHNQINANHLNLKKRVDKHGDQIDSLNLRVPKN